VLLGAVVGFLETIGFAVDSDDLGIVDKTVDQRDHAGGVWEDLAPFGKWAVTGDQRAFVLMTPRDQLEHQIGMAVGVGEIADLIDLCRAQHNVQRFSLGGAAHRPPHQDPTAGIRAGERKTCWAKPLPLSAGLWALNTAGSFAGAVPGPFGLRFEGTDRDNQSFER
jgi:hypothetical protein